MIIRSTPNFAPPQSQQDRRADKQPLKKRIPCCRHRSPLSAISTRSSNCLNSACLSRGRSPRTRSSTPGTTCTRLHVSTTPEADDSSVFRSSPALNTISAPPRNICSVSSVPRPDITAGTDTDSESSLSAAENRIVPQSLVETRPGDLAPVDPHKAAAAVVYTSLCTICTLDGQKPLRVAERTGLEPATSGVTGRRSNQLSYRSTV